MPFVIPLSYSQSGASSERARLKFVFEFFYIQAQIGRLLQMPSRHRKKLEPLIVLLFAAAWATAAVPTPHVGGSK
jgi:hypothetical protein